MRNLLRGSLCLLSALFLAGPPSAQGTPPPSHDGRFQLDTTDPDLRVRLQSLVDAAMVAPADDAAAASLAAAILGRLRLADADGSRDLLATARRRLAARTEDRIGTSWLVIAHLWHQRATGDTGLAPCLGELAAAMERTATGPLPTTFADAALLVHGMFCIGGLLDAIAAAPPHGLQAPGGDRPGATWTTHATARQVELERRSWQPGLGHFRPRLHDGEIALPLGAEPSLLLPVAAGMLLATGERMDRHLRTLLAMPLPPAAGDGLAGHGSAPMQLIVASQLGAEGELARRWPRLFAEPAAAAGFQVDAALFALTGVRIANGAGLDEQWVRWRPWLPAGIEALTVPAVLAGGGLCSLQLRATAGGVEFVIRRLDRAARPITIVVDDGGTRHVHLLASGASFRGVSLRAQPHPQQQLLPLDGYEAGRGRLGR
jgi:hypothetical protein